MLFNRVRQVTNLRNRHFLKLQDFRIEEIDFLLRLSDRLKREKYAGKEVQRLKDKNIVILFEKDSTRTRCAFEVGIFDQGGNVTYIGPSGSQMGKKESMRDTAEVLSKYYDGIEYRGKHQSVVEELGKYATVPVWNGLTDEWHPTQILADLLTMQEYSPKPLEEISFAFMGDARNNMGNTLMIGAAMMGMDYRAIAPKEVQTSTEVYDIAMKLAEFTGATITVTDDPKKGLKGVDYVHTDVWVSMGEAESVWADRIKLLKPYQVNAAAMELTGNCNAKFMHCLPSFHNLETEIGKEIGAKFKVDAMEVTDDVFTSAKSVVMDQAENRMHTIKAVMVATMATDDFYFVDSPCLG